MSNSAVCYCLGITAVDPNKTTLLMARFISRERSEPPDIDVDFEHARRETVIQYIYAKYGRGRAALSISAASTPSCASGWATTARNCRPSVRGCGWSWPCNCATARAT